MSAMSGSASLLTDVCLVLSSIGIGVLISCVLPGTVRAPKRKKLSYQGDIRRTLAVLQQLQAIIGKEPTEHDPSLADLALLLRCMQREFGRRASLEAVIQTLVAQDTERQLMARTLRRSTTSTEVVRQEAVA